METIGLNVERSALRPLETLAPGGRVAQSVVVLIISLLALKLAVDVDAPGAFNIVGGVLSFVLGILVSFLELIVMFLQAYVFANKLPAWGTDSFRQVRGGRRTVLSTGTDAVSIWIF